MKNWLHIIIYIAILSLLPSAKLSAQRRWLGGDISLYPKYKAVGTAYRDSTGRRIDMADYAVRWGWNTIRVRLFVDPSKASKEAKDEGVCQDLPFVVKLCRAAKKKHLAILLDLHYSDTWADPGKQYIPHRWKGLEVFALRDSVYNYTRHVLEEMKKAQATPDLIQVGNEITYGMLWPIGKTSPTKDNNWTILATLLNAGSKACREICPDAKIIIHTEHAQDWDATRGFYDRLQKFGVDYDVIGLSYYPMWHGTVAHLGEVVDSLNARYKREIMIVETAAYYSHQNDKWANNQQEYSYPVTIEGQRQFTADLVNEIKRHSCVTGLFWWFPEENENGRHILKSWLNRGLFSNTTGRALPAWYELYKFRNAFKPLVRDADKKAEKAEYSPSVLIIYYHADAGEKPILTAAKKIGAQVIYRYKFIKAMAIKKPGNMTLEETKTYFEKVKGIINVEYDRIYHID